MIAYLRMQCFPGKASLVLLGLALSLVAPLQAKRQAPSEKTADISWPAFVPSQKHGQTATPTPIETFREEFSQLAQADPNFEHVDEAYLPVHHGWFLKFIDWYLEAVRSAGIVYEVDVWDCDNFALGLSSFANLAAAQAGFYQKNALVGWFTVHNVETWAGVPSHTNHALVLFQSEKGIFVVEPQNGKIIKLNHYPNAAYIKDVYLP